MQRKLLKPVWQLHRIRRPVNSLGWMRKSQISSLAQVGTANVLKLHVTSQDHVWLSFICLECYSKCNLHVSAYSKLQWDRRADEFHKYKFSVVEWRKVRSKGLSYKLLHPRISNIVRNALLLLHKLGSIKVLNCFVFRGWKLCLNFNSYQNAISHQIYRLSFIANNLQMKITPFKSY